MKKISAFMLIFFISASILAPLSVTAAVNASATVPDISGTWTGTITNLDVNEVYSMVFTISQTGDQFSGTASFVITHSDAYPQDVGKPFSYLIAGIIDGTGIIQMSGNIQSGPPEIVSRSGVWSAMNWQLSQDGNTISFNGDDGHGNNIKVLLNRGVNSPPPLDLSWLLILMTIIVIIVVSIVVLIIRRNRNRPNTGSIQNQLPPPPPQTLSNSIENSETLNKFCPKCGKINEREMIYCVYCGQEFPK